MIYQSLNLCCKHTSSTGDVWAVRCTTAVHDCIPGPSRKSWRCLGSTSCHSWIIIVDWLELDLYLIWEFEIIRSSSACDPWWEDITLDALPLLSGHTLAGSIALCLPRRQHHVQPIAATWPASNARFWAWMMISAQRFGSGKRTSSDLNCWPSRSSKPGNVRGSDCLLGPPLLLSTIRVLSVTKKVPLTKLIVVKILYTQDNDQDLYLCLSVYRSEHSQGIHTVHFVDRKRWHQHIITETHQLEKGQLPVFRRRVISPDSAGQMSSISL